MIVNQLKNNRREGLWMIDWSTGKPHYRGYYSQGKSYGYWEYYEFLGGIKFKQFIFNF